jgi:hypothetical protein
LLKYNESITTLDFNQCDISQELVTKIDKHLRKNRIIAGDPSVTPNSNDYKFILKCNLLKANGTSNKDDKINLIKEQLGLHYALELSQQDIEDQLRENIGDLQLSPQEIKEYLKLEVNSLIGIKSDKATSALHNFIRGPKEPSSTPEGISVLGAAPIYQN